MITILMFWTFIWFLGARLEPVIKSELLFRITDTFIQSAAIYLGVRIGSAIALWRRKIDDRDVVKMVSIVGIIIFSIGLVISMKFLYLGTNVGGANDITSQSIELIAKMVVFYFSIRSIQIAHGYSNSELFGQLKDHLR